jgi:phospholipid-binding lipoprotein MlaA
MYLDLTKAKFGFLPGSKGRNSIFSPSNAVIDFMYVLVILYSNASTKSDFCCSDILVQIFLPNIILDIKGISSFGITTVFILCLKKFSSVSNLCLFSDTRLDISSTDFFKKSSGPSDENAEKVNVKNTKKIDIFLIMKLILVYNSKMGMVKSKKIADSLTILSLLALAFLLFTGTNNAYSSDDDPLEPMNRAIFNFNEIVDDSILEPIAKGYRTVTPDPVEDSISNFFNNLGEISTIINSALQLNVEKTLSSSGRLIINSTIGLFGLFDVASTIGIERHKEDFGQTLGFYGVPAGPYLVLPFFGPSSFRDAPGLYADIAMDKSISPVQTELHHEERQLIQATNVIDTRANLLEASKILDTAAKDKYIFLRESYLQRRAKMISDGKDVQDFEIDVLEINY